jgi:hypothetical protein
MFDFIGLVVDGNCRCSRAMCPVEVRKVGRSVVVPSPRLFELRNCCCRRKAM